MNRSNGRCIVRVVGTLFFVSIFPNDRWKSLTARRLGAIGWNLQRGIFIFIFVYFTSLQNLWYTNCTSWGLLDEWLTVVYDESDMDSLRVLVKCWFCWSMSNWFQKVSVSIHCKTLTRTSEELEALCLTWNCLWAEQKNSFCDLLNY